jgi:hypothetical protein
MMEDLIDRSVGAAQSLSKAALLFLEVDAPLLFFVSVLGVRTLTPFFIADALLARVATQASNLTNISHYARIATGSP